MKISNIGSSKLNSIRSRNYNSNDKIYITTNNTNDTNNTNNAKTNTISSYCYLPPIDKSIQRLAMQKPTSILTKFISKQAKDLVNFTKNSLKEQNAIREKYYNENNEVLLKSESQKHVSLQSERKNLDRVKLRLKFKNKMNIASLGILLKNVGKNQKLKNLDINKNEYINNDNLNTSEDNDNNINDLYGKNNTEASRRKNFLIKSISRKSKITKENAQKLSTYFRRLCSFQPKIKLNWKFKNGLKSKMNGPNDYKIAGRDIDSQVQIIDSQYRLLFNDIDYYRTVIMLNNNYFPSFENSSLTQKINYNKSLEETIGILVLLPKLLLNDFYEFINNSYGSIIPKEKKFEDKYVFDEIENLKDNNKLFYEIIEYFQESYKVFQTVVKEFDKVLFKENDFNKIISCFERARYNISYINNSSENAFDIYKKDLEIINRLKGNFKEPKNFMDKIRENYSFPKNKETQKQIRIDNSLNDKNNENDKKNIIKKYEIKTPYRNSKSKLNAIMNSRMMTDIMRNCVEDSRVKISTERINNEIEGGNAEDKIKNISNVIRINII